MSALSDRLNALNGNNIQISYPNYLIEGKMGTDIAYTTDGPTDKEIITYKSPGSSMDCYAPVDAILQIKDLDS